MTYVCTRWRCGRCASGVGSVLDLRHLESAKREPIMVLDVKAIGDHLGPEAEVQDSASPVALGLAHVATLANVDFW